MRITTKRSLFLRFFGAKETELYTLNGKFRFFLRRDETLPFQPPPPAHFIKPRFRELAFGAFIDVRALGGIALFAAVMRRIGTLFGGKYLDTLLELFNIAAENLEKSLSAVKLYVPKAAAGLAVFALAAWVFAYFRRLAALANFRVGRRGSLITAASGFLTLYEHTLVPNSASAVICDSPVSLLVRRAPLYLRGVMIHPAVSRRTAEKLEHILCGYRMGKDHEAKPPLRAWLGFCAPPLWSSAGFAAALTLLYFSSLGYAALIKTFLFCGLFVSLYAAAVRLMYMRHTGMTAKNSLCRIAARRSFRLYTAVFFEKNITGEQLSQSLLQKRSGTCGLKLSLLERRSFKARFLPIEKLPDQYRRSPP